MKIKQFLIIGFTVASLVFSTVTAAGGCVEEVKPKAELSTESLSNYSLGYMSWGVRRMGLDKLQEKLEKSGKTLPEVRVAVLDTGLKKTNRYLQGRYVDEGYNFIKNNTDYDDDQYHGTEVSGVIADGTSSNVKILPIKVMDENGDGKRRGRNEFAGIEFHGS